MSATGLLVIFVIAAIAAGAWCVVSGAWSWRAFAAMFIFALLLLFLPGFVHA